MAGVGQEACDGVIAPLTLTGDRVDVLCLGAHPDDIEIGSLGTLRRLHDEHRINRMVWVIATGDELRAQETRASAKGFVDEDDLTVLGLRDGHLPAVFSELKDAIADATEGFVPDVVFSPWSGDAHQDHRLISELACQLFRDNLHLEYEIPKYDGDLGRPTFYVPLEEEDIDAKMDHLEQHYLSQAGKPWFDRVTFRSLPRLRGIESRTDYAEAFHCRRIVLQGRSI